VLVADEAVSMIDVSLRLGILALLKDLRERLGVSVLFITHDVATARYIGTDGELYVIYRGQVVERGPVETVISAPVHPYTQALLSAIPVLHGLESPGEQRVVPVEASGDYPEGCLFAPRCPFRTGRCERERPVLEGVGAARDGTAPGREGQGDGSSHRHACFHPERRSVVAVPVSRG